MYPRKKKVSTSHYGYMAQNSFITHAQARTSAQPQLEFTYTALEPLLLLIKVFEIDTK